MRKLVLATRNTDKVFEIKKILGDLDIDLVTLEAYPGLPEVVEDQDTLEGNATKKAKEVAEYTGLPAVADDTGLEVEYLNGAPGVYSSRFAGENATYEHNVRKLLQEMKGVSWEQRRAKFRTVVAFCDGKNTETVDGQIAGIICKEERGENGFGYDPVFLVPRHDRTFSEMDADLKNSISHRGAAFRRFRALLNHKWFNK